ncbi:MAG: hypothetical protein ACYTGX_00120 [Planctomycetota bacterium]
MRISILALLFSLTALLAAGCGGTTFYDLEGGAPTQDFRGKKIFIKKFEAGAVEGMYNDEAAEFTTGRFEKAIFGNTFTLVGRGEGLKAILSERNLAESDLVAMDSKALAKLVKADAVVTGKVITAKQEGSGEKVKSSEAEVSVTVTNLQGEVVFTASQRAVSTAGGGVGIGHIKMFTSTPALPVKDLIADICKNLAALMKSAPGK